MGVRRERGDERNLSRDEKRRLTDEAKHVSVDCRHRSSLEVPFSSSVVRKSGICMLMESAIQGQLSLLEIIEKLYLVKGRGEAGDATNLQIRNRNEPVVDEEVGDTVVLDERGNSLIISESGETSENDSERGVGEEDLVAVSGVEKERRRVVVYRASQSKSRNSKIVNERLVHAG